MKRTLATVVCFLTAVAFPLAANAEAYIGVNYTQMEQNNQYRGSFLSNKGSFETGEVFFKLGGVINKYVASEVRVGTTAAEETDGDRTFRFNYHVGLYGKAMLPIGPVSPYIIGGHTWGEIEASIGSGNKNTGTLEDWSIGGGIDINLGKTVGINAEYMRYYYIGNVRYRGPSVGLYYRF